MMGIYLKDGWILKLTDKILKIIKDFFLFVGIVTMFSLGLYFLLTWLVESGVI